MGHFGYLLVPEKSILRLALVRVFGSRTWASRSVTEETSLLPVWQLEVEQMLGTKALTLLLTRSFYVLSENRLVSEWGNCDQMVVVLDDLVLRWRPVLVFQLRQRQASSIDAHQSTS